MRKSFLVFLFACALPLLVHANEAVPVGDPALEKRVTALAEELRCLVCQNQSIADSHADLAIDLKNQIREKLGQGASEREVVDYLVARYGDFVLYRPPVKAATWLLWFGPLLLLVFGLGALAIKLRQRRRMIAQMPELSLEQHRRVAAMLSDTEEKEQA